MNELLGGVEHPLLDTISEKSTRRHSSSEGSQSPNNASDMEIASANLGRQLWRGTLESL